MKFENFVGIDISKDTLDLAILTKHGELFNLQISNQRQEIEQRIPQWLSEYGAPPSATLFCAEHTGHFGMKLIEISLKSGWNLWMESPYKIVHSQGLIREKNDKIDARRIARYANRYQDLATLVAVSNKSVQILSHLNSEREILVKDRARYEGQIKQEEGFLDAIYFKSKKKRVEKAIQWLTKAIKEVEAEMDKIINSDPEIKKNFEAMLSINGIGPQTAIATILATDNFNKFDNARKFACHAGCAPFKYSSGTSKNSKHKVSHKANKNLKRLFHMAAVSTLRMKGEMKEYYDRKVGEGKNKMSVLNAIRAKLIARIFALVKSGRKYEKNYNAMLV